MPDVPVIGELAVIRAHSCMIFFPEFVDPDYSFLARERIFTFARPPPYSPFAAHGFCPFRSALGSAFLRSRSIFISSLTTS
jgi:hypothetical protein